MKKINSTVIRLEYGKRRWHSNLRSIRQKPQSWRRGARRRHGTTRGGKEGVELPQERKQDAITKKKTTSEGTVDLKRDGLRGVALTGA